MGPPSSGGSTVGEALNILEGFPPLGADRTQALHRYLEASRLRVRRPRLATSADPDFVKVPLQCLLSNAVRRRPARADHRHRGQRRRARHGDCGPAGVQPVADHEGLSTTHLTVADDEGTVVSYTFTIESTGGNGIVVPGWGFLLNNELTDFDYSSTTAANRVRGRQAAAQLDGARRSSRATASRCWRSGRRAAR